MISKWNDAFKYGGINKYWVYKSKEDYMFVLYAES